MKCTFCGHDMEAGTGTSVANPEGKLLYFCSSKCRKNMLKLRRDPKRLKWTAHYRRPSSASR